MPLFSEHQREASGHDSLKHPSSFAHSTLQPHISTVGLLNDSVGTGFKALLNTGYSLP